MASGGGDGGLAERAAQIEAKKQQARDRLNASFGAQPSGAMPNRDDFYRYMPPTGENLDGTELGTMAFDDAGYNAAVAAAQGLSAEATRNKAARDALYGSVRDNAFSAGRRGLDEHRERAARETKFALAAQGLNGGSVDIDENATLGRTYSKGLMDLGGKADAAKADMANSDEQTRLGLLQSIDAGMDQGSALSSAMNQMKTNSDRAMADAQGTALGDLFADAGLLYTKSNVARGRAAGGNYFDNTYGGRAPAGGGGGYSGIVTSTG